MITTSIAKESLTLTFAPVSFNRSSFSKSLLITAMTSTPRANKSFSISGTDERLENQSFVAEITFI